MTSAAPPRHRAVFSLGLLAVVPMLVWWLGWFPGLMSSDSMDQYAQAVRFDFFAFHPIAHTAAMWLLTRLWETPAIVTLTQVLLMAIVLAYAGRRVSDLGAPWWAALIAVWVTAALPMVAVTTVTVWKDVGFTIALVWAFAELLGLAADRRAFWASPGGPVRLGAALGSTWALRSNGFITVVAVLVIIAVVERARLRALWPTAAAVVLVGLAIPAGLVAVLPVRPGTTEPAEVFISDIAATVVHAPETIDAGDRELLEAVAPMVIWRNQYECTDGTPLAFHPRFDAAVMREDPWAYRGLVAESVLQAFPTVAGHRWCAADYLFVPVARTGSFLHYPPFDIPANDLGVARDPVSFRLYDLTLAQYQWVEDGAHRWFTWRPAIVVLAGLATWVAVAVRRRLRPMLLAGSLLVAHLGNVAATTPAQEFRYALPLYVTALISLPLWWLVVDPERATIVSDGSTDRPARSVSPAGE